MATIYVRRFIGLILSIVLQALSYALIIYLTINTEKIRSLVSEISLLRTISGSIPSIAVSVINSLTPPMLIAITAFEKWDRHNELNVLLSRMFLANILNVLILGLTYFLLANPYLLAQKTYLFIRTPIEIVYNPIYPCRMDQVQNGLFQLIVTDWVTKSISIFIGGVVPVLKARVLRKPVEKPGFSLEPSMLSNIFSAGLVLMSFPFSPLSTIVSPFMLAISMKWERFVVINFYAKPGKPIKAQKAGIIFTRLYLMTVVLVGIPSTLLFLNTTTFPKSCAVQDSYVGICSNEVLNGICTIDQESPYYTGNNTAVCSPYPECLCGGTLTCGPFVDNSNALEPLRDILFQFSPLKILWGIMLQTSYGAWFILLFLVLQTSLRRNTVKVNRTYYIEHEKSLEAQIHTLEVDKKRQAKTITRYKMAHLDK